MTRINLVDPASASQTVKPTLEQIKGAFGVVPNMFKAVANSPAALASMWGSFGALGSGTIGAKLGEQIAVAVADRNACNYCLAAHTALGQKAGATAAEMSAAQIGESDDPKTAAALSFALMVVENRGQISPERFASVEAWHDEARRLLAPLLPDDGQSINQRLRRNGEIDKALSVAPSSGHAARTIHSVKGMEFPAICVVMSPSTAKGIIDFLVGDAGGDNEEARKIYVGASRAQRLLAIAVPQSQAPRLRDLIARMGGAVDLIKL